MRFQTRGSRSTPQSRSPRRWSRCSRRLASRRGSGDGPAPLRRILRRRGGTFAFEVATVYSGRERARLRRDVGCGRREPVRGGVDRGRPVRHAQDRKAQARARRHGRPRAGLAPRDRVRCALPRTGDPCRRTRRGRSPPSSAPTACSPFSPSSRASGSGSASGAMVAISTAGSRWRSPSSSSLISTTSWPRAEQ